MQKEKQLPEGDCMHFPSQTTREERRQMKEDKRREMLEESGDTVDSRDCLWVLISLIWLHIVPPQVTHSVTCRRGCCVHCLGWRSRTGQGVCPKLSLRRFTPVSLLTFFMTFLKTFYFNDSGSWGLKKTIPPPRSSCSYILKPSGMGLRCVLQ